MIPADNPEYNDKTPSDLIIPVEKLIKEGLGPLLADEVAKFIRIPKVLNG